MNDNQIATTLVKQLRKIVGDDALWSISDIADYLNMSKKSVTDRLISKPDFPLAIRIPYGKGSRTDRRWYPNEVKKWISKHRSKY